MMHGMVRHAVEKPSRWAADEPGGEDFIAAVAEHVECDLESHEGQERRIMHRQRIHQR